MRLIDADALTAMLGITDMDCNKCAWHDREWSNCKRGGDFEDACCAIENAPTIEPEQQWIPCSEHPDTDRNVFIARGKTDLLSCCIGHYDHNAKLWYEDRNWFAKIMYDAMYWCEMPSLPEPWRREEHD